MAKQRKGDKGRFKENRGAGRGDSYMAWQKAHEFSGNGITHRLIGWITRRIYQLFSNLEYWFFLIAQFSDNVVEIREQVPLLPLSLTKCIADKLGIKHPAENNQEGKETVMTTDFLLTIRDGNTVKDIARQIKPSKNLEDPRVVEKLKIEEEYWRLKGIDWKIITENEISKVMAQNIRIIYHDYFLPEEKGYTQEQVDVLSNDFIKALGNSDYNVLKAISEFEKEHGLVEGDGLRFFKFLLTRKIVKTDMNTPFNFRTMKVWV